MAAETFKGQLRTGAISSLFTLTVFFIIFILSNVGGRLLRAVDKSYVDRQDAGLRTEFVAGDSVLKRDINELEREVERDMDGMMEVMNDRFDEQDEDLNFVVQWIKDK